MIRGNIKKGDLMVVKQDVWGRQTYSFNHQVNYMIKEGTCIIATSDEEYYDAIGISEVSCLIDSGVVILTITTGDELRVVN